MHSNLDGSSDLANPEPEQLDLDDCDPAFPSPITGDDRSQAKQLFLRYPERDNLCVAAHVNKLNFPGRQDELHMHLHALGLPELERYLVWIPYDRFTDFTVLGHGAFAATVYRATVRAEDQRMFLRIDANEGVDMRSELYFALKELDEHLLHEVILNAHLSFHRIHSSQMERVTKELVGLTRNEMTGRYMMILEYASAGNLETLLRDTPPRDWATITRHALNIARALAIVHELDLMHNDLHPGNVVYDLGSDTPFIIDIGLGAALGRSQDEMGFYGRLEYLPPEVFREEKCTQKSDVYCFGTLMWALVTGVTPRMYHARPQFADGMREEPVPGVPKPYEDIYVDCWDPDPEVRPTMVEVEQWLEEIVEEMEQAPMAPETVAYVEARRNAGEAVMTRESVCSSEFMFDGGTSRVASVSSFYNHEELSRIRSRTTIYDARSKIRRRTTHSMFNLEYDGTELRSTSFRVSTESETTLVDRALRGHQAELQNLRVALDDPMYKVLMMTLRKHRVNDDWQNYSLWIRYSVDGEIQERKLDLDEKPLRIFHDLKASQLDPIFTLKRARPASELTASPSSSSTRPNSIAHYSRPNSIAHYSRPNSIAHYSRPNSIAHHSRPNSIARSLVSRMPWSPLWTGANFESGDLVWDGVEGVLPKELLQQQCIRVTYQGQSKLLHVQSVTTPHEVMVCVLNKFFIDQGRANEFEICLMIGHEKSVRPLSGAELMAICSSPSWPEKNKLSLRRRSILPGPVTLPSAIVDGQRYASMTEMLRHCVRVTDPMSHTRLVHVSDVADVAEVMARVMTRFGIGEDAMQYKLFMAGQAAGEARELSDDALLEICRSVDRPEKQQLILRKTDPSPSTAPQGADQESKTEIDTPLSALSTLPATLSQVHTRPLVSKIRTAQLPGEALPAPPEQGIRHGKLTEAFFGDVGQAEAGLDKTAGGQQGGEAVGVTLGGEARNSEQVSVDSAIRTDVMETIGELVLAEATKDGRLVENTKNMFAEGDSSYFTNSPLDITEDIAPYFPDQRHEVVGIAQILWRRRQMRRESGWSMASESVAPGDEVRSPKTMSLYGGGKELIPMLMELMELEVEARVDGKDGGEIEKQLAARDTEADELDLRSEMAWIGSAIN